MQVKIPVDVEDKWFELEDIGELGGKARSVKLRYDSTYHFLEIVVTDNEENICADLRLQGGFIFLSDKKVGEYT